MCLEKSDPHRLDGGIGSRSHPGHLWCFHGDEPPLAELLPVRVVSTQIPALCAPLCVRDWQHPGQGRLIRLVHLSAKYPAVMKESAKLPQNDSIFIT